MLHRIFPLLLLPTVLIAQTKTAAATWMDLSIGTDVTYSIEDKNEMDGAGGGTGSGGSGKDIVHVVVLGLDANGALRIAVFDEQLPAESFETTIVRAEIATLDASTGALLRDAAAAPGTNAMWSPQTVFPFPTLTAAEWQAKKPVARAGWVPVAGEPRELPLRISFTNQKAGKKTVPSLLVELDSKQPVTVKLVGIAGMVSMAQGKMPKLGASGVEPVDAAVTNLRREYSIDAKKGRVSEIRTTGTVTAADGKLTIACHNTQRETARRVVPEKDLPLVIEVAEEMCAIVASTAPKQERRKRAEALVPKAKATGFSAMAEHLLDALTRDGLPPGLGH